MSPEGAAVGITAYIVGVIGHYRRWKQGKVGPPVKWEGTVEPRGAYPGDSWFNPITWETLVKQRNGTWQ
jgi:hypothetical protein